jgi:tRNA threonylcarbamoyladenosine biosynthesis protein TsaB
MIENTTTIHSTANPELELTINSARFNNDPSCNIQQVSILAFDTATETCVVALLHNGLLYTCEISNARLHALVILEVIEAIRSQAKLEFTQLHCIACGVGPGSFTGVRVASSVAQGLAAAMAKPLVAISTLQLIAESAYLTYGHTQVLALLDARKNELYWGVYRLNPQSRKMDLVGTEALGVVTPIINNIHNLNAATSEPYVESQLKSPATVAAGIFSAYYKEFVEQATKVGLSLEKAPIYPSGSALIKVAAYNLSHNLTVTPEQLLPVYLRNNIADVPV